MLKKNKILLILAIMPLIVYSPIWAGDDSDLIRAGALECPLIDDSVVYKMSIESSANEYPDTVMDKFFVINRNATDSLVKLHMKVKWNTAELKYISSAAGPGWPSSNPPFVPIVTESTFSCTLSFSPFKFDSTLAVIHINFRTGCYPLNETAEVFFDTSQCANNRFYVKDQPNQDYRPNSSNHKKGGIILAVTPNANMTNPDVQIVECGDTVIVPIMYNSNIVAESGFVAKWKWGDDDLKFVRVEQTGTLTQGKNLTVTVWSPPSSYDSLRVTTTDTIPRRIGSDTTLMKLIYVYDNPTDSTQDEIVHTVDTVRTKCQFVRDANSCSGVYCKFYAIIQRYSADIYFKDMSIVKNTSGQLKEELINNFTVDMNETYVDSVATFRADTTTFDTIRWDGTWSSTFTSGNLTFKWVKEDVTSVNPKGFMVKENTDLDSDHIPKTGTKREICQVGINALNYVAEDFVQFTRENNSAGSLYKRDSKLKSYNRPIVRYSFTAAGVDSLFGLRGGTVTVTNPPPPPGSCPFLYVWNGNQFLEDNDILTTSEFTVTGTPVSDYYKISQPPVEQNGQYLLQLREVEDEESFVDEVALITVDHPQNVKVGVTPEGKIVAYERALFPVACVDQEGKDHLDKVIANDGVIFEGDGPAALLLTFNNPSKKELPNDIRPEGAPEDPNAGPGPKEGFGLSTKLTVEIEDASGQWHDLGVVAPRVNAQGSFWILGSTGIDLGEQFQVKLSWDKLYSVDRLAYYVPTAKPWYQESLRLTQAGHSKKTDVTSLVSTYDGNSAKLIPGEIISLAFPVGKPVPDGMVRDFIFKSVGYYIPYDRASAAGPSTYKLHNNYPNPFNAQTEIQYALPEPSEVNLSVYNIMGQKVRTLVEGRQSAGFHRVIWDGSNEKGETVASGVYFYTIRAGTYYETKKMTLLK